MNTKSLLIAALATAFAGAALATSKSPAELQQEAQLRAPSTLTRAGVHAQVLQAQADGTQTRDGEQRWSTPAATPPASTLKRADVRADVLRAQSEGTLTVNSEQRWSARGERLSQGDSNRNSPSVHKPHDDRGQSTVASRDAAAGK